MIVFVVCMAYHILARASNFTGLVYLSYSFVFGKLPNCCEIQAKCQPSIGAVDDDDELARLLAWLPIKPSAEMLNLSNSVCALTKSELQCCYAFGSYVA